jgi:putative heme utilization carrier protein HutX
MTDLTSLRTAVAEDPGQMTSQLARRFEVPEAEVLRAYPADLCVELDPARCQELIESFAELGKVHVIVSSRGATLEAEGVFGGFSTWGEFFNVQTDTLDMHIRWQELAAVFAFEKPSHMNGVATLSFQFFDPAGQAAFKVFLNFGGKPTAERAKRFAELRERFRK